MENWKRRMINEEKELNHKINLLSRFLRAVDRDGASDISTEELMLMFEQFDVMVRYDTILRKRMEMHQLIVEVKTDGCKEML